MEENEDINMLFIEIAMEKMAHKNQQQNMNYQQK
jgi:hypothetical protein